MSGMSLTLVGDPFPSSAASLWLQSLPAYCWHSNQRSQFVPAALGKAYASVAHHAPDRNFQESYPSGQPAHLSCCWTRPGLSGPLGTWKRSDGASPFKRTRPAVQNGPVLWTLAKSSHGEPGRHPELERPQLQAGFQTRPTWVGAASQSVFLTASLLNGTF